MECLDEQKLERFRQGLLAPEALAEVVRHLDGCEDCRERVEATTVHFGGDGEAEPSVTVPAGEPAPAPGGHTQELSAGSQVQARVAPLERGSDLGRYVVLAKVGEGGMGVVYAAYDPQLDRKVALKLLRPGPGTGGMGRQRTRLLREAQALARLSHPSVISVYDVGTLGEQIFVAMEFVDGGTLRAWLRVRPRSWREVLAVLLRAGRGLAAAHTAGLIHRDFKPDNVLIGSDGRVRVTDFGLARPVLTSDSLKGPGQLLEQPLTLPGALVGTPAYMSPEQLERREADARSDQFAFCVVLYEALYGQRPFTGRSVAELTPQVLLGKVRPPPEGSPVPAWVRKVIFKGLSVSPADRYPSMDALLERLRRDPRVRRRRWLAGVAALACVGLGAGALSALNARQARQCRNAGTELSGIWDVDHKHTIQQAFLATHQPFAQAAWTGVEQALDRYAATWAAVHTEACEATRVRHEQSEEVLGLRMLCLEHGRKELEALTGLLAAADAPLVEKAVQAAHALTPVDGCADPRALASRLRLPEDAHVRGDIQKVREELATATTLLQTGRYTQGLKRAKGALEEARALRQRPLEAEALLALGRLQHSSDDLKGAEASLTDAVLAAEATRDTEVAARAWTELVGVTAEVAPERGLECGRHAEATLEAWGGDEALRAELLSNLGKVYYRQGRYPEAQDHFRRALALSEKVLAPTDPALATAYHNAGMMMDRFGQYDDALAYTQRGLDLREKTLGPDHPLVARSLNNLGLFLNELGRSDEARRNLERSLAILQRTTADSPRVAMALNALGNVDLDEGRYPEAQARFERSLRMYEKTLGPESVEAGFARCNVGITLLRQGHPAEGRTYIERAVASVEKSKGPDYPELSGFLLNLGEALVAERRVGEAKSALARALDLARRKLGPESYRVGEVHHALGDALFAEGRHADALAQYQQALAIREKAQGKGYVPLGEDLTGIGRSYLALKAPAQALPPLERALSLQESHRVDQTLLGQTRFALARALWDAGTERAQARTLAEKARDGFLRMGAAHRRELVEVGTWLRTHAGR